MLNEINVKVQKHIDHIYDIKYFLTQIIRKEK